MLPDLKKMKFYGGQPLTKNPDILLVSVPRMNLKSNFFHMSHLPGAISRLKACVQEQGFTAACIDLDNDFVHKTIFSGHKDMFDELDFYFLDIADRRYYQYAEEDLSPKAYEFYQGLLNQWVDQIIELNPKWLGISIFLEIGIKGMYDLAEMVKKRAPHIKIVIGGWPLNLYAEHHSGKHVLSKDVPPRQIGEFGIENGVIDYFITGEGDISLVELLKGNTTYPGINNHNYIQVEDLDSLPLPDYSDFNMLKYVIPKPGEMAVFHPMVTIMGSRGCVRKCTFCDIADKWPVFKSMSPEKIFEQIVYYHRHYGISNFYWADSLVNAIPKNLDKLIEYIADYNEENDIVMHQNHMEYIIRPIKQQPPELFDKMKKANIGAIHCGIESGSQNVRNHMRKGYTNKEIQHVIDQCLRVGILISGNMIVGYPNETEEDWYESLAMAYFNSPANTGHENITFSVNDFVMEYDWDESPLNQNPDMLDITFDPIIGWVSPWGSYYVALRRSIATYPFLESLGFELDDKLSEKVRFVETIEQRLIDAGRNDELIPPMTVDMDKIKQWP